jgi:hypothetical protein
MLFSLGLRFESQGKSVVSGRGLAKEGRLRYNTGVGELKKAEATSPPKRSFLLTSAGRQLL